VKEKWRKYETVKICKDKNQEGKKKEVYIKFNLHILDSHH
jgi:hypothetical protein